MKLFATEYPLGKNNFGSYVYAKNKDVAKAILTHRGLGEVVKGDVTGSRGYAHSASRYYELGMFNDLIHWLCFAGNVLINAGLMMPKQLLNDRGLIHMACHQEISQKPDYGFKEHPYTLKEHKRLVKLLKTFDQMTKKLGY